MATRRGILVVFEGIDHVGKSTQLSLLERFLKSKRYPTASMSFPNRTTGVGRLLDRFLKGRSNLEPHTAHLLFSANRWEQLEEIKRNLMSGVNVLLDRYSFSGVAYSAASGQCDFGWCMHTELGLLRPDIIFFLDLREDQCPYLRRFGGERFEDVSLLRDVGLQFKRLIRSTPHLPWIIVNAKQTPDEIQDIVQSCTMSVIEGAKRWGEETESLW